jgi:hypothetical protein
MWALPTERNPAGRIVNILTVKDGIAAAQTVPVVKPM